MIEDELQKRFEIVKLAVTIGDRDTLNLQIQKLKEYPKELGLDEIISLLESRNYRQAIYVMKTYLLEKRLSSNEEELVSSQDKSSSLKEEKEESSDQVLELEDILKMSPLAAATIKEYKAASNLKEEAKESIEENIKENKPLYQDSISKDQNGDIVKKDTKRVLTKDEPKEIKSVDEIFESQDSEDKFSFSTLKSLFKKAKRAKDKKEEISLKKDNKTKEKEVEEADYNEEPQEKRRDISNILYPPIPDIDIRFRKNFELYPPIKEYDVWIDEVRDMIQRLSRSSYTEDDIEEFLFHYKKYLEENEIAKAAQVLLLAAATESEFAQYILARELFKGVILIRNVEEAFRKISHLAEENYPEAICDLAQFYEYGIVVKKDKKMAELLYEDAAAMGIKRAKAHLEKLRSSKLFKFFKKN